LSLHTRSKFRLLIVRLGAMGDILHALPAVTALRLAHPGWVIDWVVEPRWAALLEVRDGKWQEPSIAPQDRPATRPIVDKIHVAPTRAWRKAPFSGNTLREIKALRVSLRKGNYDAVLDLQGAIRSAAVARMAGCRRVIGESKPREGAARWFFSERIETRGAHIIEQDLELASAVAGDDLKGIPPHLPVDPAAESWADRILPPGDRAAIVLINPGAGWGAKRWPVERYAAVAQGLIGRGMRVLINTGPGEEALTQSIVETEPAAISLNCTLEQLIAVTRRITLAIAGDTGPLHLACALERSVVGIYGPTDPRRNGPFGTRFRVLRSPESRRDHSRHTEPEAGLMTISPQAVLQAADDLLKSGKSQ